ncbi:uncharacterized protein LOC135491116 [Lineus longissimus]|uniref:uncharacterized protein LOC135491116 n=1 Tax=Lineus longissimus TaxID=88925 RepID=UPI00315D3265
MCLAAFLCVMASAPVKPSESFGLARHTSVTDVLTAVFSSLTPEEIGDIESQILLLGSSCPSDLQYIEEQDLGFLKPIQKRKLLAAVKNELKTKSKSRYRVVIPETDAEPDDDDASSLASTTIFSPCSTRSSSPTGRPSYTPTRYAFEVPFKRLPRDVLKACKKNKRPTASGRRETIRIIADDLLADFPVPVVVPRKTIRDAAIGLVKTYPESFQNRDMNGLKLGNGYESVFKQIENCVYNKKGKNSMPQTATTDTVSADDNHDLPEKKVKLDQHDQYGCTNWAAKISDTGTETVLEATKKRLLEEFGKDEEDYNDITTVSLQMKETYPLQRRIINADVPIASLKKEWPFLFKIPYLLDHFEKLTGVDLASVFEEQLVGRNKGERIFNFMISASQNSKLPALKKWIEIIKENMATVKSKKPASHGVVLLINAYFDEQEDALFRCYGIGGKKDDILKDKSALKSPYIAVLGDQDDILLGKNMYYLVIEGEIVNENVPDFSTAVQMLFASFYVLNIKYPMEAEATLEFLQR